MQDFSFVDYSFLLIRFNIDEFDVAITLFSELEYLSITLFFEIKFSICILYSIGYLVI